jgi:hypothetical protein
VAESGKTRPWDSIGPHKSQRLKVEDKVVQVREWFNYAQDKVPLLTRLFLGQEQFVSSSGAGTSFPILPLDFDSD